MKHTPLPTATAPALQRLVALWALPLLLFLSACGGSVLDKTYDPGTYDSDMQALVEQGKLDPLESFAISIYIKQVENPGNYTYGQLVERYRAGIRARKALEEKAKTLLPTALAVTVDSILTQPDAVVLKLTLRNTTPHNIVRYDYKAYVMDKADTLLDLRFQGNRSIAKGESRTERMKLDTKGMMGQMGQALKGRQPQSIQVVVVGQALELGLAEDETP